VSSVIKCIKKTAHSRTIFIHLSLLSRHRLRTVTYLFFVKGKVACDDLGERTRMKVCDTVRVGERSCDFVEIK